jgi:hypothetical protein
MTEELEHLAAPGDSLQFHHIQMYVRALQPLAVYKELETMMCSLTAHQERVGHVFLSPKSRSRVHSNWDKIQATSSLPDPRHGAAWDAALDAAVPGTVAANVSLCCCQRACCCVLMGVFPERCLALGRPVCPHLVRLPILATVGRRRSFLCALLTDTHRSSVVARP